MSEGMTSTHFLGIGGETRKRRVFWAKNRVFIGDFGCFGPGNEEPYDYAVIMQCCKDIWRWEMADDSV